jgi:hypothetical protein
MSDRAITVSLFTLKDKLVLTLLGSYDSAALVRLKKLKKCLIDKGYEKCRLVSDYSSPIRNKRENDDQYFLRKSVHWLERSDACIFVFFNGCRNDGVAHEIKHTCDHLQDKLETSLVAIESKCSRYSSSLVRGTIDNFEMQKKLNRRFFKDDTQLCRFSNGSAINFLRKLRYHLLDRL